MKIEQTSVEYIMHMGDDLNVVDNARVSFDKTSEWEVEWDGTPYPAPENFSKSLKASDAGLIRFLALGFQKKEWNQMIQDVKTMSDLEIHKLFLRLRRHATHFAPFCHPHVQVRVVAPVFLARQLVKHQIGLTWSEVSRRYVDDEPSFWFPDGWRARAANVKQGSSDDLVETALLGGNPYSISEMAEAYVEDGVALYSLLLENNVAPELSRIILPQNMMVTWRWTGSLMAFARIGNQRLDAHAQKEAQKIAAQLRGVVEPLFPNSWDALVGDCLGALEV